MGRIRTYVIEATPSAGGAGASTVADRTPQGITGRIVAIGLTYLGSPPAATTDVTITVLGDTLPDLQVLKIENAATDSWWFPRHLDHDETGVAVATRSAPAISGAIEALIEGANDGDGVRAMVIVQE